MSILSVWRRSLFLAVCFALGIAPGALAEGESITRGQSQQVVTDIPFLNEVEQPLTTAEGLMVQQPAPTPALAPVTGVQLKPTDQGLEVILETAAEFPEVLTSSADNSLITDIPNAQLRLPSGEAFRQDNPTPDIASVEVVNLDAKTIRVTVTGKAGIPTAEVSQSPQALILSVAAPRSAERSRRSPAPAPQPTPPVTPAPAEPQQPEAPAAPAQAPQAEEEKPVEFDVVAEEEAGEYNVPDATTATKTDTPIRDIPASIQVVPQQVLEDRNVRTLTEAVETVSGVVDGGDNAGATTGARIIRGFRGLEQEGTLRNGLRDSTQFSLTAIGTIEQVEVLKGPASVLFGALSPGGITNVTTKQPLSDPYYKLAFEAGNFSFYQPSIDLSGPLTADETVLYRFIASYQSSDDFQDFVNTEQITIAPSITLRLGDRTDLNLYYEYIDFLGTPPENRTGLFSDGSFFPRDFFVGYPEQYVYDVTTQRFGYKLNHEFSDNWQLRNGFAVVTSDTRRDSPNNVIELIDDRFLTLDAQDFEAITDNYFGQIDLLGKLNTGAISHQLLVGFDFNIFSQPIEGVFGSTNLPPLDIFNPDYDVPDPIYSTFLAFDRRVESYGVYLQDQITLLDNLKLLIGGRYDWVSEDFEVFDDNVDNPIQNDGAFSPRIGLVYQPIEPISLYASYSRSFTSTTGFNPDGRTFEPTKGTQYEVGVKADFLDDRLSTTLAAYEITRSNITTPDPDNPTFSIQVGEERSRGIELDIGGEILPGWKVTGSYAYTDAKVTEDNVTPEGNRLEGVPENQASLWTTYEIQEGDLRGLGVGLGLFYVGNRQGDLDNSFELGDYLRTDAAIYYRQGQFNAAINIRNLFDTDYIRASDGGRFFLQRGAPLTIVGSIGWEF